ncbi:hypothetical protein ACFWUQ_16115 [Streptomyces sp. NPDC058662]
MHDLRIRLGRPPPPGALLGRRVNEPRRQTAYAVIALDALAIVAVGTR